ncbi:MAG: hypothetical protein GY757_06475, partial [bacterium]|nr:hypothetical protein [bacterium]
MKTKQLEKKLTLIKATVANLEVKQMSVVRGGGTMGALCVATSLAPQNCADTEGTMCTRESCRMDSYDCPAS